MKIQKRFSLSITLIIAAMIFLTINLSAQQRQGQGRPQIPNESQIVKMVNDLSSELSLNGDQKTEILALYQDHFAEVKSSMNSGQRPNRDERESLKSDFEDDVKNILNDEQEELFTEYMKKNNKQSQSNQRQRR